MGWAWRERDRAADSGSSFDGGAPLRNDVLKGDQAITQLELLIVHYK